MKSVNWELPASTAACGGFAPVGGGVTGELSIPSLWRLEIGAYVLLGLASPLLALPVYEPDALPTELDEWRDLPPGLFGGGTSRIFSHPGKPEDYHLLPDPTALPFLIREDAVRAKIGKVELTIIGHLHSGLVLWKSRILAGMPPLRFMGTTVKRLSTALSEARHWRPFHVRLCPALSGVQLLKDGGHAELNLDPTGSEPARFVIHRFH